MDDNTIKGLIGAAGKAIALAHGREGALERLDTLETRDGFREFLEGVELGMAEPSRTEFIEAVTAEDRWEDWRSQLAASANVQYHEFISPSA